MEKNPDTAVHFTGICEGQQYDLEADVHEYRSLMALLRDKIYPDDFGQCGGMGRCGTCLVRIEDFPVTQEISQRNEQNTLIKMGVSDPVVRLSCQVQVDHGLDGLTVQLIENV